MINLTPQAMRDKSALIRQSYNDARRDVDRQRGALEAHTEARKTAEAVAEIVSKASQAAQMRFAAVVAGVVTESLNSVYPNNPYEFRMEFRECAGKTVVDTLLYRDGEPLDPMSSTGGGVWNVLAFALRVSMLVLTARDDTRMLLALDEPFAFLHGAEKIRRAYETLESVQKQFGLTVVCVRNIEEINEGIDNPSRAVIY